MPIVNRKRIASDSIWKLAQLKWPTAEMRQAFICASIWLSIEWGVVYGGANWISSRHNYRIPLQTQIDDSIPFVPAAAIIYLSLFPMLWLSLFVFRSPMQLQEFARALSVITLIAGIGFVLVPVEAIAMGSAGTGIVANIFRTADYVNLTNNYFPSLHVGMAVVCAISYSHSASPSASVFYWLWAALIALATLLTRQHYVIDVVAGGLLGAAVTKIRLPHTGD